MSHPARLGKYEIRRELGKGSMGVVYEAFDPFIERRVAIKIIRQDQLGPSQTADLLARLKREAQAAGRLNHPGIVAIYDYGEDSTLGGSGVAYITMELIDGRELKDSFDENRHFSQQEVVRIMGEVLSALQHAHERGVTHRDIKPSNVILLRNGHVKVADFGVARLDTSELTQAGTMIGTPMYMSPEQILGLPVDGRSDLFACGVMLYQFLTGEKPFTGSITTVMQKVLHQEPVPATQLNADLSPAWDAVLRQALAKKPEDRFPSAAAMAEAIAQAARQQHDAVTVLIPRKERGPAGPAAEPGPEAAAPPPRGAGATLGTSSATAGTAEAVRNALSTTTIRMASPPPPAAPATGMAADPPAPNRRPLWLAVAAGGLGAAGLLAYLVSGSGQRGAAPAPGAASAVVAAAAATPSSPP
ncbi:MAG: serine/threonine protein kinase, partial [Burkholderiales bacterium]|nr:serine/threonine protein kinase [Burkholderiales bacterium]